MNRDQWLDELGEIADRYIIEAVNYSKPKRRFQKYIGAAALAFLCICGWMFVLGYNGNFPPKTGEGNPSTEQGGSGGKPTDIHGGLSVIAYAAAAEGGHEKAEEEQGTKLEENVEVFFSEYSPLMSSVPAMPFSFVYNGTEVKIKVSASAGRLRKYEIDREGVWHVSEENKVLYCKSGEKIYWEPAKSGQRESVLTVEAFQDNILLEKKEISIKWNEDTLCYTAVLKSKEGIASSQGIIDEAMKFTQRVGVYAPDLLVCNRDYLAFANLKGMIIYDRKRERAASVIDLQEMDCNNFLSDSRHTCVFAEEDEILFFNMKSGKIEQNYYRCSFSDGLEKPRIMCFDSKGKEKELKKKYEAYRKNWQESDYQKIEEKYLEKWDFHSEHGIRWKNEQGERMQSTLLVEYTDFAQQKICYSVLQENLERGTCEKQKLNIDVAVEEGGDAGKLPAYEYTGENEIKKAVYNYVAAHWDEGLDERYPLADGSSVQIPYIVENYGVFHKGNQSIFFGNILLYQYVQVGDILESMSGGEMYVKVVLKKGEEGYSVKRFQAAEGDGGELLDSVRALMKGYPEARKRLDNSVYDEEAREAERKRVIRQYVKSNGLVIRYYKDYGWDKVKLFG